MASGGIGSPSASASGKASAVVINGGRRKRISTSTTVGKKKLWNNSSTTEIFRPAEPPAAAAAAAVESRGRLATKKKEVDDYEIISDDLLVDAARALTEFSNCAHMPSACSLPTNSSQPSYQSNLPALRQWATRKRRSVRGRQAESPTNDALLDAATVRSPSPVRTLQVLQQQVSESSSPPRANSQTGITPAEAEEDPVSRSALEGEEERAENEEQGENGEEREEESKCPSDPERLHKLISDSSVEFPEPDSRVESPNSPLSALLPVDEYAAICIVPKFEGSLAERSAFKRVVPIRPVKKSTFCRKPKVEERAFEALNPEQAAVKHPSRKKPRPTGLGQHHQQQLAPVKIEEADTLTLALGARPIPVEEQVEVKKAEETITFVPDAVVVEKKAVKFDPVVVKVETKLSGRFGQRTGGKVKPALSESEKEARKQRRVQANRESARLTIRKKQVLCEDLSRRSQLLITHNERLRKEVELKRQEKEGLMKSNARLKEQVAKAQGNHQSGSASPARSAMESQSGGLVQYQLPPAQFHPQELMLLNYAKAAGITVDGHPSVMSALAAAAAFGNSSQAGHWKLANCSQGQVSALGSFFPEQEPVASAASSLPSSSAAIATTVSPLARTKSLPVAPADASFSVISSERSLASYRSGDFADSCQHSNDLKRNIVKRENTHPGSGFNSRAQYFNMTPASQTGLASTGLGSMAAMRKPGEGIFPPVSKASGQLLSRSHSLTSPHFPKMGHLSYPMFGSGGISVTQERPTMRESEARRAAALATEARRKRRELTRTKSMQHRQVARPAESAAQ